MAIKITALEIWPNIDSFEFSFMHEKEKGTKTKSGS